MPGVRRRLRFGPYSRGPPSPATDAATAPVIVTTHKKPHRVLISWKQYQELIGRQRAPRRAYGVNELPDDLGAVFDKGLAEGIEETERGGE